MAVNICKKDPLMPTGIPPLDILLTKGHFIFAFDFGRYLAAGATGLGDSSSRPASSPRAIDPAKALLIVELRRRRMIQSRIATSVVVSVSTVSRVLARAGLSKLSDLAPAEPMVRYEHDQPGDLTLPPKNVVLG